MGKLFFLFFFLGIGMILFGLGFFFEEKDTSQRFIQQIVSPTEVSRAPVPQVHGDDSPYVSVLPLKDGIAVGSVYDGDTIETEAGEKIRLLGINAPETGQPYSSQATQALKEMVLNHAISLSYDVVSIDRYGRTLAYVYVGSTMVNEEMVKRGLAVVETIAPNGMFHDAFLLSQEEAKTSCKGLWSGLCGDANQEIDKGCIHITSIVANPPGDDTKNKNGEYISFQNTCTFSNSLKGFLLKDSSASNAYEFGDITIDANAYLFLHSGCGENTKEHIYWKCPEQKYAVWNNLADHAFLFDNEGDLISEYSY